MMLALGMGIGLVYLALSINVYLEAQTRGQFKIGYGIFGPTEARIALAAATAAIAAGLNFHVHALGQTWQALDIVAVAMIAGMLLSSGRPRRGQPARAGRARAPGPPAGLVTRGRRARTSSRRGRSR